jgi:hypothetical protein
MPEGQLSEEQSEPSRATVEKLQLNRAGVINLRRVLRTFGEHPPQATEISRTNH